MLANYPKRTDLWHLYIDKEIKRSNFDAARRLFERVVCTKLSVKNMKNVFKKFLKVCCVCFQSLCLARLTLSFVAPSCVQFEELHGDTGSVEQVKQKARDYVTSIAS